MVDFDRYAGEYRDVRHAAVVTPGDGELLLETKSAFELLDVFPSDTSRRSTTSGSSSRSWPCEGRSGSVRRIPRTVRVYLAWAVADVAPRRW